ncbi:methyltransferase domain-containing protein [Nocardioides sp.]|uniref:methyltransferase domain-containing protein n=1 Tax=Nocardioides sp. TaxID=35761 RepID=UPI0035683CC4
MRNPLARGWEGDPLWGSVYDWTVEHRVVGGALWKVAIQSELGKLYAAAAEVAAAPAGSRVLDVPCGGGVAMRALMPGQGVRFIAADISERMIDRTVKRAQASGVADQVTGQVADVAHLPFDDSSFDLVTSFTGLHCFPDPARAVIEMTRVLKPGGVITGSTLITDAGLRYAGMWRGGRFTGLLGPGCSSTEIRLWLTGQGMDEVTLTVSGAMGYFRGVKGQSSPTKPLRRKKTDRAQKD